MDTAEDRVAELAAAYGDPRACAAELLCDRHPAGAVAFTIVEPDLRTRDVTFGDLRDASARFASALSALGVGPGDRVATLMTKSAELVITVLGIWRLGAVQVPLFTAFAPNAIALRVQDNGTKVIIADSDQRAKLEPGEDIPADPDWRIITNGADDELSLAGLLASHDPLPDPVAMGGDGTLIELFTSGTTGRPKGVPVPVRALAAMQMYQEYALGHEDSDVFWNAADPGWAYGLFYAIVGPLVCGRRSVLLRAGFTPELTWRVLAELGVTNFAAAPTVYRALRSSGGEVPAGLRVRRCSSAGEPLNAEVVSWARQTLGIPVLDHYGQTEVGMVAANCWHPELRAELKPGSMGRALPGWQVEVLRNDADEVAETDERGRVAVDCANSTLMYFTGYQDAPERTAERFSPDGRWYYTGDVGGKDTDGYLTFAARDDDVILMAGYRIGPFDVESVLMQHDAVAEVAVIGAPDELRGEVVVAYVVPKSGVPTGEELTAELQQLVKTRFAAHAYPRAVHFVPELPKTPSGKIQRFLLRRATSQ